MVGRASRMVAAASIQRSCVQDTEPASLVHEFAFSNEIVTSHVVIISLGVTYPDPLYQGRSHEASCERGAGAAPASDGGRNLVPGPYSGSLAGHYDPARSDHGQRHKGQDAALARRKARGVTLHAQGPAIRARPGTTHSRADPGQPGSCALWRADPLGCEGDGRRENEGDPLAQSRKQGPIFFDSL